MTHLVVLGFGPVSGFKYSRFIQHALSDNRISSYSIIDIATQQFDVMKRIESLPYKPSETIYLNSGSVDDADSIQRVTSFLKIKKLEGDVRALISTEPQAHEHYIKLCVKLGIKTLTTKPLLVPFSNGKFSPQDLLPRTENLIDLIGEKDGHALICSGKFHEIFEDNIRYPAEQLMSEYGVPITSVHMKTNSGVWNLNSEYNNREDHPYKYGYGMLYHGAYHYISVLSDLLELNKNLNFKDTLTLTVSGYAAFPDSQNLRITAGVTDLLQPKSKSVDLDGVRWGETDSVFSFKLAKKNNGEVITLGTLSLEQTGPGFRAWTDFPDMPYNKNGRLHDTELDVKLGTLASYRGHITKVPIGARKSATDVRTKNIGIVFIRKNAEILECDDFFREKRIDRSYGCSFSFTAEKSIFDHWLSNKSTRSEVRDHLTATKILQALGKIVYEHSNDITFDF